MRKERSPPCQNLWQEQTRKAAVQPEGGTKCSILTLEKR